MVWVRSQGGKMLINANMLYVDDGDLLACIGSDWDLRRKIGIFSTREQAIEELNKIQKWINERGSPDTVYQVTRPRAGNSKGEPAP